jgi:hypothetical protein
MKIRTARVVFTLQGLFLLFTSSVLLLSPKAVSKPGAQFEGTPDDVVMNFGYDLDCYHGIYSPLVTPFQPIFYESRCVLPSDRGPCTTELVEGGAHPVRAATVRRGAAPAQAG